MNARMACVPGKIVSVIANGNEPNLLAAAEIHWSLNYVHLYNLVTSPKQEISCRNAILKE